MSSAFDRNVSVSQPYYCKDENGDLDYDHPMYTWMAVRSRGPNTLNDNHFCGENKFGGDVQIDGNLNVAGDTQIDGNLDVDGNTQIDGDLNVDGNITGNINVMIDQTQIMCNQLANVTITVDPANDFSTPLMKTATLINLYSTNPANTSITGLDRAEIPQCQIILYNASDFTFNLRNLDSGSLPQNQFSFNPNTVPLQPREAVNVYYNEAQQKWVLVSHI